MNFTSLLGELIVLMCAILQARSRAKASGSSPEQRRQGHETAGCQHEEADGPLPGPHQQGLHSLRPAKTIPGQQPPADGAVWSQGVVSQLHADLLPLGADRAGRSASSCYAERTFLAVVLAVRHQRQSRRLCGRAILDRHKASGIFLSLHGRKGGELSAELLLRFFNPLIPRVKPQCRVF